MAKDLAKELEKFHLTKNDNVVVGDDLQEGEDVNSNKKVELMMIGQIFTTRPFNIEAMKRMLRSIWRLKEGVAVRMVETNLFVFQFSSLGDKEFVINGMPWFFDNQLLLLKEVRGDEQLSKVIFRQTSVWVRVYDLPFVKRNANFASCIGENMGGFVEVDESDPLGLDNFLRIKVMIDVGEPLRRGMKISTSTSGSKWVDIIYERLEDFCYYCGKLGHLDRDCKEMMIEEEKKEMVYRYGPWMRASPLKWSKMSKEENDRERLMKEKLNSKKWEDEANDNETIITKLGPPSHARRALFKKGVEVPGENAEDRGGASEERGRQCWVEGEIGDGDVNRKLTLGRWRRMYREGKEDGTTYGEEKGY
ncbi:Gag polyprotein [Bienertia sinuspersici]